jgi:hypothetical protein
VDLTDLRYLVSASTCDPLGLVTHCGLHRMLWRSSLQSHFSTKKTVNVSAEYHMQKHIHMWHINTACYSRGKINERGNPISHRCLKLSPSYTATQSRCLVFVRRSMLINPDLFAEIVAAGTDCTDCNCQISRKVCRVNYNFKRSLSPPKDA